MSPPDPFPATLPLDGVGNISVVLYSFTFYVQKSKHAAEFGFKVPWSHSVFAHAHAVASQAFFSLLPIKTAQLQRWLVRPSRTPPSIDTRVLNCGT